MFIVVHPQAFDEAVMVRIRALCDAHLKLREKVTGQQEERVLEVGKMHNGGRSWGNLLTYVLEPGLGMRIVPLRRVSGAQPV